MTAGPSAIISAKNTKQFTKREFLRKSGSKSMFRGRFISIRTAKNWS